MRSSVPCSQKSSRQNWLMNKRSLLEVIERGNSCNLMYSKTKWLASCVAEMEVGKTQKWAYLKRRSTSIQMHVLPCESGRWVTKSIEISSHIWDGMGKGWRRPLGVYFLVLFVNIVYCAMKVLTVLRRLGQKKLLASRAAVSLMLEWPSVWEQWYAAINLCWNSWLLGTNSCYPWKIRPSL